MPPGTRCTTRLTAEVCRVGGEVTTDVLGVRDLAEYPADRKWRKAVRSVAAAVGRRFDQHEVFVTFSPFEFSRIKCGGGGDDW